MTNKEAIETLKMLNVSGLADEAKHKAIEALEILDYQRIIGINQRYEAMSQVIDWAIDCDFGYDNIPEYEKYKEEIEELNLGYKEGIIYIASRELEEADNEQ